MITVVSIMLGSLISVGSGSVVLSVRMLYWGSLLQKSILRSSSCLQPGINNTKTISNINKIRKIIKLNNNNKVMTNKIKKTNNRYKLIQTNHQ